VGELGVSKIIQREDEQPNAGWFLVSCMPDFRCWVFVLQMARRLVLFTLHEEVVAFNSVRSSCGLLQILALSFDSSRAFTLPGLL